MILGTVPLATLPVATMPHRGVADVVVPPDDGRGASMVPLGQIVGTHTHGFTRWIQLGQLNTFGGGAS